MANTQESINRRRQMAQALQQSAMLPLQSQRPDVPVHATQGAAKLLEALFAGLINRKLDKQQSALDTETEAARNAQIQSALTGGDLSGAFNSSDPGVRQLATVMLQNQQRTTESEKERASDLQRQAIQMSSQRAESESERMARSQESELDRRFRAEQNAMERQAREDLEKINVPAPARPPSATITKVGPDGKPHIFRQNPQTGAYDIDEGLDYIKPSQGPVPIVIQTAEGPQILNRATGTTSPITGPSGATVQPAPTADMRNKQEGRKLVDKSIDAIETLSKQIITKIGPAQRADAIKRGAEAVFGSDPEFRTYQDARMSLAGNLAVGQQGSRPSDADIKAIWLPLVPDPYRDTAESAQMKWALIKTMSNAEASAPQNGDLKNLSVDELFERLK